MNCLKVCAVVIIFLVGNLSKGMNCRDFKRLDDIQRRSQQQVLSILKLQAHQIEEYEETIASLKSALEAS